MTESMLFLLGVHRPNWLRLAPMDIPLFVSRVTLMRQRTWCRAAGRWMLDSGGFSEIERYARWTVTPGIYAAEVALLAREIGGLEWAAPQDWMCEPHMLARTGLTVEEHQQRTVGNFLELRGIGTAVPVIPVLQGWALDDYLRCAELYESHGVDLAAEPLVGVGSVCRRQRTAEAAMIFRRLAAEGLRLHGFGVKVSGIAYADTLTSADSMAWSYAARWDAAHGVPTACGRRSCANCLHYALNWREFEVLPRLDQLRLWEDKTCVAA